MFEKWDIPDNICDNYPIGLNSLDLFVGHSQQTKFLSDLLSNKSVVILEGEIGVGKTSMGNYIRHSKKDLILIFNTVFMKMIYSVFLTKYEIHCKFPILAGLYAAIPGWEIS